MTTLGFCPEAVAAIQRHRTSPAGNLWLVFRTPQAAADFFLEKPRRLAPYPTIRMDWARASASPRKTQLALDSLIEKFQQQPPPPPPTTGDATTNDVIVQPPPPPVTAARQDGDAKRGRSPPLARGGYGDTIDSPSNPKPKRVQPTTTAGGDGLAHARRPDTTPDDSDDDMPIDEATRQCIQAIQNEEELEGKTPHPL